MTKPCTCGNPLCLSQVRNEDTTYDFIPEVIDIMGHPWRVTDMHPAINQMAGDGNGAYEGYCDAALQEIAILPGLPEDKAVEVLFHEIVESLNNIMTLDLEHTTIQLLALGFFQVLYGNDFLNLGSRSRRKLPDKPMKTNSKTRKVLLGP